MSHKPVNIFCSVTGRVHVSKLNSFPEKSINLVNQFFPRVGFMFLIKKSENCH